MSVRTRDLGAIYVALEKKFGLSNGDVWRVEGLLAGKNAAGNHVYFVIVYKTGDTNPFQIVQVVMTGDGVATLTTPASNTSADMTTATTGALALLTGFYSGASLASDFEGVMHI